MNEVDAAKMLYASLRMQKGTVNVVPFNDGKHGVLLKVWVAPDVAVTDIPSTYQGFPVVVERRPIFSARHLSIF